MPPLNSRPALLYAMAVLGVLLLANFAVLLVLREQVLVEGVPTAENADKGIEMSTAASSDARLVLVGFFLVPRTVGTLIGLALIAQTSSRRAFRHSGFAATLFGVLLLVASPIAGSLVVGYGW